MNVAGRRFPHQQVVELLLADAFTVMDLGTYGRGDPGPLLNFDKRQFFRNFFGGGVHTKKRFPPPPTLVKGLDPPLLYAL